MKNTKPFLKGLTAVKLAAVLGVFVSATTVVQAAPTNQGTATGHQQVRKGLADIEPAAGDDETATNNEVTGVS